MTAGERIRRELIRRTPTTVLVAGGVLLGLGRMLRWLAVHTTVAAVVALAVLTWWATDRIGWAWLAFATGCICIGLGGVMELQPRWWLRLTRAAASRRRLRWYRQRWEPAMVGAGLTAGDDVPRLVGHRFGGQLGERDLDVLMVRTVPGQVLQDWRHAQTRLAAAWGRSRVRAHPVRRDAAPAVLELFCSSRPLPDRRGVAGGQVPHPIIPAATGPAALHPQARESTAVDEPVDETGMPPGMASGAQHGAFPRTPRADRP